MALDERLHAPHAGRVGGDLGAEVAGGLVLRADLRQDQREDVVDDRAALDELDRRDDHALLEDLPERADGRRRAAADVDVVREVGDVAEQLAVVVDRRDQADVVEVDAARVGVVRDDHVAGPEVARRRSVRTAFGTCSTIEPRCTGCANPCATERSSRVEERAREVRARLDVRRVRAPPQRERHLVGRRDERVADHLERDRVYPATHTPPARARAHLALAHVAGDELGVALGGGP